MGVTGGGIGRLLLESGVFRPEADAAPASPGVAKPVFGVCCDKLPKLPAVDRSGATLLRLLVNDFAGFPAAFEKLPAVVVFGATAERLPAIGLAGGVGLVLVIAGFDPMGEDGMAGFPKPGDVGVAKLGRDGGVKLGLGVVMAGAAGGVKRGGDGGVKLGLDGGEGRENEPPPKNPPDDLPPPPNEPPKDRPPPPPPPNRA